jgi:hypothetical protein
VEFLLKAALQAIDIVRPALEDFYASLTDEQKARFNQMDTPQQAGRSRGQAIGHASTAAQSKRRAYRIPRTNGGRRSVTKRVLR